ncbi:molecular chaperone Hsp20 [Halobacteriales archaeon QS_4_69_34]|nr:MAG: molecular chaperone Hsp20 [Halobacteriales archaeon QS_4_69_34]
MSRRVGESLLRGVIEGAGRLWGQAQERRPLPADLLESEDAYLAVFDAPGVRASDVQVRYTDGELFVRLDRAREHREGFEMRAPGRGLALDGRVALPEDARVDPDGATATLTTDGALRVELPKADEPTGESIHISAETATDVGESETATSGVDTENEG